ncbi:MAG TPA: hypothetical protein VHW05_11930 [Phenylobacterium sp.]|nr:hypothetical protein [Phenylobacterium sp.]
MQWSMPHRLLQAVAAGLVLIALSAFTLGVMNAPQRGRMPGEKAEGSTGAAALVATDATPLSADRIEGAAPAHELTSEEKEKLEADKEAKEEADEAIKAAAATAPPSASAASAAPTVPTVIPTEAPPPPSPDEAPH